ncbi:hypothetical protein HPP92_025780 [Vanilla planifolia]|uniref:Uncharacterized protein n=1 Tax=Vanilla planifolia TaxID=51239 RepID=A0A835PI59_VANPL|nr:hypothetical protein HPP92_025780 [Vanilla planifolia]
MERKTLVEEVKKQLCLAGPLIAANLLSFVLQTISLMYIGRFGKLQLSGAAVAMTFTNVTGFAVLLGMGSALETLCGQAYGAKQAKLLGIHLQRAVLVLAITSITLSIPCYHLLARTPGWDSTKKSISDVPIFIKLAIPSALIVCLEFWSFEILVIISGLLPNPLLETSVLSVSLNISSVVFMITMGLGAAISIRVSNELGAGNPQAARLAMLVSTGLTMTEGLVVGSAMVLMHNVLGRAYSNDKVVVKSVAAMVPLVALSHFINTIQCVFSGISRGCGWQYICVWISLGSFYAVGFPVSIVMAFFVHLGGKGLWLGIICALSVQDILLVLMATRSNLGEEANKAREKALSFNTTSERHTNLEALSCENISVEM